MVVMGHSRRGNVALWATAHDLRIDGVWHPSGTGGTALARHREGETIGAVNMMRVPHGDADDWADPEGARLAVDLAAPTFHTIGRPELVWSLQPSGHEVTAEDSVDAIDRVLGLA